MNTTSSTASDTPARTHTARRLSDEQIMRYQLDGYLIYREPVLPAEDFAALQQHFERHLAALSDGKRPENMDVPHFADPELFRWLAHPAVLDLVEPILGPDIALFSSHFICKPAGSGRRVPWHEDSAYWRGLLEPMEVVTVWLALDPSLASNGAMRVIPRTHHHGYSDYEPVTDDAVFAIEIQRSQVDDSQAVTIELAPNQASLHHTKLVHGSNANPSALRRCGYTMRYMSAATRITGKWGDTHEAYLLRGSDRAGNRYGDPQRPSAACVERARNNLGRGH